ncbi:Asp-tRNA(Asn)/Glu-tRNA(Gln) amidotransferase subunit GatA [Desulfitobacterium sp. AusDCA]|uniref:Asp-tRNA(Asn)/Glu-tRNA(Gln) amidotransferase subunit GatA n=1 Tax=Desulfitobacterium sp. AusDCA TaxID=3240383 RepID=UPI003DA78E58
MEITSQSIGELHKLLTSKKLSTVELTQAMLDRIKQIDPKVRAFLHVTEDLALSQAAQVDEKIAREEEIGILEGIPMALKDNMSTEGIQTTCSSKILENYIPPYNATAVAKLKEAGAILLGKMNMDEFAMGSSTENSHFFATHNPWDLDCVPGGSSGGSAAAVAAEEAIFTLGSDTGGSIRQPAAFCGVVGLKPTYGAVSRFGLIAYASSLDQIGPFTKTVEDNAQVLQAIVGHDRKDSTSVPFEIPNYSEFLKQDVKGLRIGVPKEYFAKGLDEGVKGVLMKAVETFKGLGAIVEECSLPYTEYAMPAYYLLATAEASSNLARYDGVRYGYRAENVEDVISLFKKTRSEGFGPEVKRRIMLGTYALSAGYYDAYYLKAQKVRTLIQTDFNQAFEKFDVLLSPTAPTTAFKIGEKSGDPLTMYLSDVCTVPINLAGIPALSLPAGFVEGMPVGMQLMGRPFSEGMLYRAAHAFEQNTDFHTRKPSLAKGGAC